MGNQSVFGCSLSGLVQYAGEGRESEEGHFQPESERQTEILAPLQMFGGQVTLGDHGFLYLGKGIALGNAPNGG